MRCTATVTSGETTTAAELTATVHQQRSTTDSDLSTVTTNVTRVTDSQTLTGTFYCTTAILCRLAQGEHENTKHCFCSTLHRTLTILTNIVIYRAKELIPICESTEGYVYAKPLSGVV